MDNSSYSAQDRWRRVEELFYVALDLSAGERRTFLSDACDGDPELRNEVESLLVCSDSPPDFLEQPVQEAARRFIAQAPPGGLAAGAQLGHYQIVHLLGSGGMGDVYLAHDTRLRRKVALKMLKRDLVVDQRGLQRFQNEAQTVSALNHPNIVTLYEFAQVNGFHFIVTEFVEGRTVRDELRNGPLDRGKAVDIAIQIACALEAAHSSGIIHRDIKPDNVAVRSDALVKVLDFGIAKLTEPPTAEFSDGAAARPVSHTRPGTVVGTAKYMSPEQARGTAVDARSDIFSLGIVLYEMVTGRAPFTGETESDVLAEVLKGEPPPLADSASNVPKELERIVDKALRKDRTERYQTVTELLADLQSFKSDMEFQAKLQQSAIVAEAGQVNKPDNIFPTRWRKLGILVAALVLVAFVIGYLAMWTGKATRSLTNPRTLAVLPFRNVRHDPQTDFLGFSLADAVITKLGYLNAVTVRPSSSVEKYRNEAIDIRKAAKDLKVSTLLTGSFLKDGNDLRITAQLVDVNSDKMLWQDTINLNYDKLLTVQDRVAQEIIRGLELKLTPAEAKRLRPDQPMNRAAYEYYLRGVDLYSLGEYATAIKMLEKSASLEPNYGPTWAHLGRAYTTNASLQFGGRDQYGRAQAAYERALALDPTLTEPRIYMANLLTDTGRVEQAVPLLRTALESSPNNAEAHWELGYAYRFGGMLNDSIREGERARQLDPEVKINSSAMNSYLYVGEYDKFLRSLPANDSVYVLFYRGFAEYYKNNRAAAAQAFDRAFDLAPHLLPAEIGKALSDEIANQNRNGLDLLHETESKIEERGVSDAEGVYKVAQAYAVLGDKASALRLLRRSIEGGFFCYSYQKTDPLLHSLHADPAFDALMDEARQRHEQFKIRFFGQTAGLKSNSFRANSPAVLL